MLIRHAIYFESIISLLHQRIKGFEAELQSQLGGLATEVETAEQAMSGKLDAVKAKVDNIDQSVAARLDAHVEAATTRSQTIYDGKCDSAATGLEKTISESVAKIEAARTSMHDLETRSANVSRDLTQMDRSMSETLNAFRMPIVLPALGGGLVGAGVGAFVAILLWRLLAGA